MKFLFLTGVVFGALALVNSDPYENLVARLGVRRDKGPGWDDALDAAAIVGVLMVAKKFLGADQVGVPSKIAA